MVRRYTHELDGFVGYLYLNDDGTIGGFIDCPVCTHKGNCDYCKRRCYYGNYINTVDGEGKITVHEKVWYEY